MKKKPEIKKKTGIEKEREIDKKKERKKERKKKRKRVRLTDKWSWGGGLPCIRPSLSPFGGFYITAPAQVLGWPFMSLPLPISPRLGEPRIQPFFLYQPCPSVCCLNDHYLVLQTLLFSKENQKKIK